MLKPAAGSGFAARFFRCRTCEFSDAPLRLSGAKRHGGVHLVPAGCVGSDPHHRVLLLRLVGVHGPGFSKVLFVTIVSIVVFVEMLSCIGS